MNNNKLEAALILDRWYRLSSYCSNDPFCITHKDFKSIIENKIFIDKEVVKEINIQGKQFIVYNDIKLFDLLSIELKNDKELVLEILKTNGNNFNLIKNDLKDDKDVVLVAIESEPKIFVYVNDKFKDDDQIVNIALDKSPDNFSYISKRFKNDKDFILNQIKKSPSLVSQIESNFKEDIELLAQVWENIKKLYINNNTLLRNNTVILFNNIGQKVKPFFDTVDPYKSHEVNIKEMDNIFNRLILNKELNSELKFSNKQDKKIKI